MRMLRMTGGPHSPDLPGVSGMVPSPLRQGTSIFHIFSQTE